MAVTLVGVVANNCDATTGFNQGAFGTDDAAWEGSGAIGIKASATTVEFYTTSITGGPYDFSSGGTEEGDHMILWFNTKTPVNSTTGLTMIMGNGTDRGRWNVIGTGLYPGGWSSRVISPAEDFDLISAGTWTTTGNVAQLSNVTEVGGGFTTTTSIMGSFNNVQIDHITVGTGLRVDAGTVGTPNTFETLRAADEGGTLWGWFTSSAGAVVAKGKAYLGPATGTATSVFDDSAFTVIFADERVAVGFYEILTRGTNTDVTWELANIASAVPANARWSLTVDSTTKTFSDTNGVWSSPDAISLNSTSTMTGTTVIDGNTLDQNSATITDCAFLQPNRATTEAFMTVDSLADVTGNTFQSNGTGHAIDLGTIATATTLSCNNTFLDYAIAAGTAGNKAILVNYTDTGSDLIINVTGGTTPTVNNIGAGTVVVQASVSITVTVFDDSGPVEGAAVYIETTDSVVILNTETNASGVASGSYGGTTPKTIDGAVSGVKSGSGPIPYQYFPLTGTVASGTGYTANVLLSED